MSHKVHRKTCSPSPSLNQTQNHSVHQQQKLLLHQGQTRQSLLPSLSRPTYQFLPCHQLHHQHLPAFFAPLSTFFFFVYKYLSLSCLLAGPFSIYCSVSLFRASFFSFWVSLNRIFSSVLCPCWLKLFCTPRLLSDF